MTKRLRLGVIKVLTRDDPGWLNNHGRILEGLFPDVETVSRCIEDQPQGIFDEATLKRAEPKIVRLAAEMEREGLDGLFVSCAEDPAVEMIKPSAKIPVLGAGTACALMALSYRRPVGVLGLDAKAPTPMLALLEGHMSGAARPEGVVNALDLQRPGAEETFVAAARGLCDRGAGVIALACTGFSTLGIAPMLSRRIGAPVVDPVVAGGYFIRFMMRIARTS
jgi:Asp/Glu/hydantoin racemase